jgi:hypothetical protein
LINLGINCPLEIPEDDSTYKDYVSFFHNSIIRFFYDKNNDKNQINPDPTQYDSNYIQVYLRELILKPFNSLII